MRIQMAAHLREDYSAYQAAYDLRRLRLEDPADLTWPPPPALRPLTIAWRTYERKLDLGVQRACLAA